MTRLLYALLFCFTLSAIAAEKEQSGAWSEDGILTMALELVALPDNDLQKAQMKLSVMNKGTNVIILDKALAAGFSLRFKTDLSEEYTRSDEKDVKTKEVKILEKPTAEEVRARFVRLTPGQSLSRMFDLAKPIRKVVEGHATDMKMLHYGFYYEALQTYQIPAKAKRLELCAWYERGFWMMSGAQFEEWYGLSAEKIGLWTGRARSNTLVIQKK